ncbi:MAG: hypothetical protein JXA51_03130 [Dehalococcoidales bacterium]|nr:hypothetical protein [Dehalococcoidales bacterium]
MLREELRKRLVEEYRYAVNKMQETDDLTRKLFYFSVFFGEAKRLINWEWNRELSLVHLVTQQVHTQINAALQAPNRLPIDWIGHFKRLTQVSSELATYFENVEKEGSTEEIYQILGHLAEIGYTFTGNGHYLYEKGILKI